MSNVLRDLLSAQGVRVSAVRAQCTPDGWRVTVTDAGARILSTDIVAGPPAAVRATLARWILTQD
jgi:hypothetical protein